MMNSKAEMIDWNKQFRASCSVWVGVVIGSLAITQVQASITGASCSQDDDGLPRIIEPRNDETPRPPQQGLSDFGQDGISNVFLDSDIRQSLNDIAVDAGVTIVVGPAVSGLVTAELENVTLDEALEILLAGTGYLVERRPNYYVVYKPDPQSPAFRQYSETTMHKLNNITAEELNTLLPSHLREIVTSGTEANMVVISAPSQVKAEALRVIQEIDRPRRHVLLRSRIVVMDNDNLRNIGLEWGFPGLSAGAQINDAIAPNVSFGVQAGYTPDREFTDSLLVSLNLLQRNQMLEVIADPSVMVQDGNEATVAVRREEFFRILAGLGVSTFVTGAIEQIETGTLLEIVPRIGDNDEITLEISTEVSGVVARRGDDLPVVSRRTANSVVQLRNGGTAAIAGLIDTRQENIARDVPRVARLPIVGRFFQNDSVQREGTSVCVFITAEIVNHDEVMSYVSPVTMTPPTQVDEELFRQQLEKLIVEEERLP